MSPFKTFTHNVITILVVTCIFTVQCFTVTTDGKCDKGTHGKLRLYENKNGDDEVLVCAKKSGNYQWKFLDGTPSIGEKFDPANSCSDIVDNKPNPTDDFYWVRTEDGQIVKVWCDVHTDGGGFMLVGVQDNPSLWNVSFKNSTINPIGPSQWSSYFGNLPINEFAVQISENQNFDGTKAHWLYRLKSRRQLGNLLSFGNGGCTSHSGVGDIQYVKDILTNTVLKKFSCSKFGLFATHQLGWGRINHCLRQGCSTGFAYSAKMPFRLDNFGSFSYSTVSQFSGITHNSTAFVGCDDKKCCACFGPKGGSGNYCGTKCRPINGGTVLQDAHVWFWVRTTVPRRKKCMEFRMKTEKGSIEKHFIDRTTGSVRKVKELQTSIKELKRTTEQIRFFLHGGDHLPLSTILGNNINYLKKLKQWLPSKTTWQLCWLAPLQGWAASVFHQNCDNKGPTVTIIKVGVYIFGGYTDVSWGGSPGWGRSTKSFIFSLKNKDNLAPFKAPVYRHYHNAIYTKNNYGPTFGGGHDIHISNNAHTSIYSHTNLGATYQLPSGYSYRSSNTQTLLAGSYPFQPSEIEVYFQS